MWTHALLIVACLWALVAAAPFPTPIWSPEQVGDYFNGIFRSVVGPILGFDNGVNNNNTTSN
ncbi:uncharacterized protein LOC117785064 [Drosophila innubila]|uniref:uncharacterized protein LOC117785064 n=1 Tax=Drosophila innubila TaxID=198719 RepID=UPI00148CCD1B|nr:uncharacterized protein LOC117785064 [Drosophila innubila]